MELILAEKNGSRKQFTRPQLEAMGKDFGKSDSFDGWQIIEEAPTPPELLEAPTKSTTKKAKANVKQQEQPSGKAEATGPAGTENPDQLGENPAQGSEGDANPA